MQSRPDLYQDAPQDSSTDSMDMDQMPSGMDSTEKDSTHLLLKYINFINIAKHLTREQLAMISNRVLAGFEEDQATMTRWMQDVDDAQSLSQLTKEPKNTPLPNSANIKFPLITNACQQFAARTYPELIQDGKVVKCEVVGQSTDALERTADNISTHMSYQLLGPDSEWEASMDKLLVMLPNIGFQVKKTYFDAIEGKNRSDVCNYKDIVLRNDTDVTCLNDLRRITHILYVHNNDLIEGVRAGIYEEDVIDEVIKTNKGDQVEKALVLYEQHCFLDLDEDGYEEPYIVTLHRDTMKVIRIKARFRKENVMWKDDHKTVSRINPIQYFTDFHFLPSPDGRFISVGFGTLMLHLNETVNTILNQLIDAGSLANMQTGFIDSRLKIMGGQMFQEPGQWNKIKGVSGQMLKDGIVPLNYKEPSQTLYQLLGMLVGAAKELSSSTEVMQGTQPAQNVPATTIMALVEQGMKVFNSIQRRLYRALKDEFQKLFNLNKIYLDTYSYTKIVGNPSAISINDYQNDSLKIMPVANPNLSSDAQRMAKQQVLITLMNTPLGQETLNPQEVMRRVLISLQEPNPELLLQPANQKKPDPKMMAIQVKAQKDASDHDLKNRQQDLKEKEFVTHMAKVEADITKAQAQSVKLLADAHAVQKNANTKDREFQLDTIKTKLDNLNTMHKQLVDADIRRKQLAVQAVGQQQEHARKTQELAQNQQQIDQDQQSQQPEDNGDENGQSGGQDNQGGSQ